MYVVFHSNFAAYIACRRYKPCEFLGLVWTDCWGNKSYYDITSPANIGLMGKQGCAPKSGKRPCNTLKPLQKIIPRTWMTVSWILGPQPHITPCKTPKVLPILESFGPTLRLTEGDVWLKWSQIGCPILLFFFFLNLQGSFTPLLPLHHPTTCCCKRSTFGFGSKSQHLGFSNQHPFKKQTNKKSWLQFWPTLPNLWVETHVSGLQLLLEWVIGFGRFQTYLHLWNAPCAAFQNSDKP